MAQMQNDIGEEFHFELDTILSTYCGHTIFSLFIENFEVYRQVLIDIERHEFEKEEN